MKAIVVARTGAEHQVSWGGAFAEGLRRHGIDAVMAESPDNCDLLVLWSARKQSAIALQKRNGGEVCILERGYLGDRFNWTSVSFGGGLNGRAIFRGPFHDASRFYRHFGHLLKPWNARKGYALLIGQVPGDMSIKHASINDWYHQMARDLIDRGYKVMFRMHPGAIERGYHAPHIPGVCLIHGTLQDALAGAGLVVTFNSNTGVDSVLAGKPTLAFDPGSMAWPVSGHAIGEIVMPDRTSWAAALAWKQWTLEEMESGVCWDAVRPH